MRSWILPCNIKKYNIIDHFKNNDLVIWKYHHGIIEGDIGYIYLSIPYQEVRYKCRVINKKVRVDELSGHEYAFRDNITRYIALQLEREYPSKLITYKDLKECGLGQVLNICVAGKNVCDYIEAAELRSSQDF